LDIVDASVAQGRTLARDPEKWVPVFGKDHAQSKNLSGMMTRREIIPLQAE
jgi:hypothetical protein